VNNSKGTPTMGQYISSDLGATVTPLPTPFYPPGIGMYDFALKLHSGKILMAGTAQNPYPEHCALIESDDSGRTWYCRRMLSEQPGTEFLRHHKYAVQGRDGIIHVVSTYGSGTGDGSNPHVAFSEQWLREGTCIDVAGWGINTDSMVAPCPVEDTLHTGLAGDGPAFAAEVLRIAAFPNPFKPATCIRFTMPGDQAGVYGIYSVTGALVKSCRVAQGTGSIRWDGRDALGRSLASGLYIGKLVLADGRMLHHSLLLLK
jgi:hypothetical protein